MLGIDAPGLEPPASVSDLSERELIARIHARLPSAPDWMVVGVGDDAAVVEPARNRLEVLSVDAVVDGVHFNRAFTPYCYYNPTYECPIPPQENRLAVPIRAGERMKSEVASLK